MISKMFLLLLALIIILGLHCSYSTPLDYNQPSVENFSTLDQPHMSDRSDSRNNSRNYSRNNIIGDNHIDGYDPETEKIQGYCFYDDTNIPTCNRTKLPIHGCAVKDTDNVNSNKLQQNTVYEFYENSPQESTESQQVGGASEIYGRPYQPVESIESCPKPKPPRSPPKPPGPPPICPETCIPHQFEECRDCDITSNKDINKYVLKNSVPPCPDMTQYAKKSNLCPCTDMSKYILKSKVPACNKPNMNDYIQKSQIPSCPTCPKCPTCPDCDYGPIHNHPDHKKYILREECEKQCEKHIKDEITKFEKNDPKFKKEIKKYLKDNDYIKRSECKSRGGGSGNGGGGWNGGRGNDGGGWNGGSGGSDGGGWNGGSDGGGWNKDTVHQTGYSTNGNYNDLYQNC